MPKQMKTKPKPPGQSNTLAVPYPPGWFDRFTTWVDRLPGPAWSFYLILGLGVSVAGSAIQWIEGAYPLGTFNPLHVWTLGNFAYLLALMHYLDKSAFSAITSFRPILAPADEATFASLAYQLTTLPPRSTLLASIAGVAFSSISYIFQSSTGTITIFAGTADTTFSHISMVVLLLVGNAISFLLAYHTIHQLLLINRIYTQHARISIYELQFLYALSIPGAFTGIGVILFIYIWFATATSMVQSVGPVEFGLSASFGVIAVGMLILPLIGAHRRILAEKNKRLAEISSHFEKVTEQLLQTIDTGGYAQVDHLNKSLASLGIVQSTLRGVPTWPLELGAVRALLAALILPIAIWAIQLLLGRLLGT